MGLLNTPQVGLIYAFALKSLILAPAIFVVISVFLLWFPGFILFNSVLSYSADKVENAEFLFIPVIYGALLPYIAVTVVDMTNVMDGELGRILSSVFALLIPPYVPFGCLYMLTRIYLLSQCSLRSSCGDLSLWDDYLSRYDIWTLYVACTVHILFYFFLLRFVDVKKDGGSSGEAFRVAMFMQSGGKRKTDVSRSQDDDDDDDDEEEDSDVRDERITISNYMAREGTESAARRRVVAVSGLRKEYKQTDETAKKEKKKKKSEISDGAHGAETGEKEAKVKVAVKNLNLGVGAGEVFGLLGHNGAGKTTSMRMIIAEEAQTKGKVRIGRHDINSNISPAFALLGYCPQFDAIWKVVTVKEHLQAYAAIRGVDPKDINR